MRKISIIGSTGSLGTQTLDVVRNHHDIGVCALSCGRNIRLLEEQVREFRPQIVHVYDEKLAEDFRQRVRDMNVRVVTGMDGMIEAACVPDVEITFSEIVGMIGIRATMEAIRSGKNIALANKETLVCAGHLIMPLAEECGVKILPVDSEHSAIFQCLNGENRRRMEKIYLTCSGGPFRGFTEEQLRGVTREDALRHPNWSMGQKVTIDSATLINKGLEVMEAGWLFGAGLDRIEVVVHPQSIIHSAVQFRDGAVIAQLGIADMRLPIQYALYYPDRRSLHTGRLDLFDRGKLTFERPDRKTFRGLDLAGRAMMEGGTMCTVFNAANEEAVARFLDGKIHFLDIYDIIEDCMDSHVITPDPSEEKILETQQEVMERVQARWDKD